MNQGCPEIRDLIPLYIKQELTDENRLKVEEHLTHCPDCSQVMKNSAENHAIANPAEAPDNCLEIDEQTPERKQRNQQFLTIVAVLLLMAAVGIISYGMGLKPDNDLLEARDAVRAFKANGLELSPKLLSSDPDLAVAGVFPTEYQVNKSEDSILVYVFASVNERRLNEHSIVKYYPSPMYRPARNLMLFYQVAMPETREEYMATLPTLQARLKAYNDTALLDLNQGETVVLKGNSEHWQGEITIQYFQYWFQNENDMTGLDSYAVEKGFLRYTGDEEELKDFSYTYRSNSQSRGGTMTQLNGTEVKINEEGSGANIPEQYQVKLEWNGQAEEFEMTRI